MARVRSRPSSPAIKPDSSQGGSVELQAKTLKYLRLAERSNPEGEEIRAKRLLASARSERRKIPRDGDTSDGSTGPSVGA